MTWLYLLPAGFLVLLLVFAAGAIGQRHLYRSNPMSLSNPLFLEIVNAVKSEAEALLSRAEKAETDLAEMLSKNSAFEAEVQELKAELSAVFSPAPAVQTETPAA